MKSFLLIALGLVSFTSLASDWTATTDLQSPIHFKFSKEVLLKESAQGGNLVATVGTPLRRLEQDSPVSENLVFEPGLDRSQMGGCILEKKDANGKSFTVHNFEHGGEDWTIQFLNSEKQDLNKFPATVLSILNRILNQNESGMNQASLSVSQEIEADVQKFELKSSSGRTLQMKCTSFCSHIFDHRAPVKCEERITAHTAAILKGLGIPVPVVSHGLSTPSASAAPAASQASSGAF